MCVCVRLCVHVRMVIWWYAPASTPLSPVAINTARETGRVRQTDSEREKPQPCLGEDGDQSKGDTEDDAVTTPCVVHIIYSM